METKHNHPIQNVRFSKRLLNEVVEKAKLENVQVRQSTKGFYIDGFTSKADPTGRVLQHLANRLRLVDRPRRLAPGEHELVGKLEPRGSTSAADAQESPQGICAAVRTWAKDHPSATVHDAVEAFPEANKTTVRIQFNKAH